VTFAVSLAWVAGFVDGAGYLLLQKVFVAHQSGNTVGAFVGVSREDWSTTLRRGVPIALFVIGVALGAVVLEVGGRRRLPHLTSLTLSVEAALLAAAMVSGATVFQQAVGKSGPIGDYLALLVLLVVAMGLQTATLRNIGRRTVRTTYVTGMLTHFAENAARYFFIRHDARSDPNVREKLADRRRRLAVIGGIWCSYAIGGIAGGAAEIGWTTYALAVPVGVLVVIVLVDQRLPWHAPSEDPLHAVESDDDAD
jgi:uncharacterized membrane protein YoaK (UPF0700 family)